MKFDAELVEYVVREVIRRLAADERFAPQTAGSGSAACEQGARELNVPERLVTLATLRGKLDGVTKLTVARRSVITPAVRDELKKRGIILNRE